MRRIRNKYAWINSKKIYRYKHSELNALEYFEYELTESSNGEGER